MKTRTLLVYRRLPAVVLLLAATTLGLGAEDVEPREGIAGFPGPKPGDVFREYTWTKTGDSGFLRVGGRVGYGGGPACWPHDFDLTHAMRAEVVLEKRLCHDGMRGLAIYVNGHAWLAVPETAGIAEPQWDYQHHTYPVVPVPLDQFQAGTSNQFRLRVSDEHPWKWPQNLLYGVHVRVYYDAAKKSHPARQAPVTTAGHRLGRDGGTGGRSHQPGRLHPPNGFPRPVRGRQPGWRRRVFPVAWTPRQGGNGRTTSAR